MGNQLKKCQGKSKEFYEKQDIEAIKKKAKDNKELLDSGMKAVDNANKLAHGEEMDFGDKKKEGEEGEEGEDNDSKKEEEEETGAKKMIGKFNAGLKVAATAQKYKDKDYSDLKMDDLKEAVEDAKDVQENVEKIEA